MESLQQHIDRVRDYFDKHVLRDAGVMKASAEAVLKAAESALSPTPAQVGDVITVNLHDPRRDVFAGHALAGLLANQNVVGMSPQSGWQLVNCTPAQIVDYAVHIGEQMVWASNQRDQQSSLPPVTAAQA